MADFFEVKRSNFAILLNNSRTLWPIDVKFSGMMDMRSALLICDNVRSKMADLSEVKRSNLTFYSVNTVNLVVIVFALTSG